ncbi:MAG TPA: thioredoxin domain-containing protein [Terriglobales bacterium]|jgi:uncharacterized protein YyaL (SSP411 family)|nr:thioredoxin domain-containing protein [Terriglobales bacterium]
MASHPANALERASSAYLRSAMHQPIQWHEWGDEAFAAARRDNKPILLDIGAVWCHWCHVMDRESYESAEVAEIINRAFVAIKVDRDERPDIDARYQAAVSAISGQGGWPLTAFLTPEGKPFYGGTYFPPDDHWGRPGFKRVLAAIAQAFQEKHGEVMQSADSVMTAISQAETFAGRSADFSPRVIDKVLDTAARMFDPQHGGFGNAPKFPHPAVMELALDRYAAAPGPELKSLIVSTLEKMARGGVYDQLAGGFHRYSVDERWVVPHFEKMSYDNSELLKNYVHGFQATGERFFAEVARDIVGWMDQVLSDRAKGGFFASQDADISLDDDGDYFTWTLQEARSVLSEDEAAVATLHYDIGEIGEMHHNPAKNVLYQRASLEEISTRNGMPLERVRALLDSAKKKLLAARRLRPTPYIDKTVYVSWNALCISAYLAAARALKLDDARHFALRSLDRLLAEGWDAERGLSHVIAYSDPAAAGRATRGLLDDYAYLALACLDAYEATADLSYFSFARRIADAMIERFYDAAAGGFFDAPQPAAGDAPLGALAARRKPFQDSPTPAGNPSAAIALLRLFSYTNHAPYRDMAEQTLKVFAGLAEQFGIFAGSYGIAAVWLSQPHTQVIVVGEGEAAARLEEVALAPFALTKAVLRLAPNQAIAQNLPPALAESIPNLPGLKEGEKEDRAVAVVCSGFTCQPPVSDPQELERLLRQHLTSRCG